MEISSIGNSQALAQVRQQIVARADANGDLDIGEFEELGKSAPAGMWKPEGAPDAKEAFAKFDADGDGQLTEAELEAGMQSMMERWRARFASPTTARSRCSTSLPRFR